MVAKVEHFSKGIQIVFYYELYIEVKEKRLYN